jgi:hypothetical protein
MELPHRAQDHQHQLALGLRQALDESLAPKPSLQSRFIIGLLPGKGVKQQLRLILLPEGMASQVQLDVALLCLCKHVYKRMQML